ncbi:MAG TPA: hypothetical protein VFK32_02455 [Tepidiformaceae bacterium]|nr:hypothetical protein [Tepidiformaceae bacterium]
MTRYLRLALLLGALMAVLAFAVACGGDDKAEPSGGDDEESTATAPGGEDDDDPTAEPTEEDEEDGDALERLRAAAAAAEERDSFYASYEMRFVDADGVESTGTMTLAAKKPLELFRIEVVEAEGESGFAVIQDAETSTFCIKDVGEEEGSCLVTQGEPEDSPFGSLTSLFSSTDELLDELTAEDDAEVTPAGSKRVAGLDADCYDVKDSTGEGTVCIAEDESLVVEVVGTFEGQETEFRLTEYSDDPDDDVFEPPYEVTSLAG